LDLSHNTLQNEGAEVVANMIKRKDSVLEKVILENCKMGEWGLEHIFEAIAGNRTVKEINIKGNLFKREEDEHLTMNSSLSDFINNKVLLVIDLSGCNICDIGMQRMFMNLTELRPWRSLNLSDNHITEIGLQFLSSVIRAQKIET
jgi:Ran GTPase-activating protein (RanGAP) involved in mRNA processing and transport